ncbi:thiamine pyrophosphate enzyme, N-terminal TPP binding domain protein [Leptospira inadai serovar Lyme str. 10]|uniref:Thiamine pyrophosphate enzyme, N-terminal TPP binding domain protein n=2 Tax=Leptospira inadai serovar Lyme TaxID=293084 RepID=V6HCD9_9LEPT|nr:thiamine pyrophosphate-binding protein [Leptospira inadai]EQA36503.1 thiamine pyrophosphate enzyme, N-terminal TPP binding domain protein [Leptospira inadai serovar Lyme str. 10]PNV73629.1 acetolactate synthase large subunit [Leptospira inadai serovar Lyme]
MKKSGASLVVHALEQVGVKYTFGIPGVHNTELYDELSNSKSIVPILVTHECGAAFMADAISRTSDSIGTLVIVPAAGMTHALSGIGEAYLDGIPMLIISGGVRTDTGKKYQLHQIDQSAILKGITKKFYQIQTHGEIVPTIYEAYKIATTDECGPVFIEIPVNIQLFEGSISSLPDFKREENYPTIELDKIEQACELLKTARHPGIFVGWGGRDATEELIEISEILNAPVATTLQGLSVFPANHPHHTGMGFGSYSVPAGEAAFSSCDCLLAIGTRFAEIPTGSFGMKVPKNLIHIDINPNVFSKNYPAAVEITGDSKQVLSALIQGLERNGFRKNESTHMSRTIREKKEAYFKEWEEHRVPNKINPYLFFKELRAKMKEDDILIVDDGNHTFLAEELYPVYRPKTFLSPTDFNSMGYCVPASIGAKLVHPGKKVVGIVGDGAFLMTGLELITATVHSLGAIIFVFYDGELSQISQGQQIPYGRKTCTILGELQLEGVARATGAVYISLHSNDHIETAMREAFLLSEMGRPVIVDVKIDYSKATRFTEGVVKANLGRFPLGEKFRFIGRALIRRFTG